MQIVLFSEQIRWFTVLVGDIAFTDAERFTSKLFGFQNKSRVLLHKIFSQIESKPLRQGHFDVDSL